MKDTVMQQIIISGVGGQGILFVTKLLAETALRLGYSVLISETHGMAQRGGNVISHLKVQRRDASLAERAPLTSPLVRPGRADVLLALHPDAPAAHGFYLKPGGVLLLNDRSAETPGTIDATAIAAELGSAVAANLVMLGFATGSGVLFCDPESIRETLVGSGGKRLESSLAAFSAGWEEARKRL
ncbi:MAG: indolepyruvate oxidoreductase subunit beta [Syntrophobacteraceae bacterium]